MTLPYEYPPISSIQNLNLSYPIPPLIKLKTHSVSHNFGDIKGKLVQKELEGLAEKELGY